MSLRGCWLPTTWLINMSYWNCSLPNIRHWILDPMAQFPSCGHRHMFEPPWASVGEESRWSHSVRLWASPDIQKAPSHAVWNVRTIIICDNESREMRLNLLEETARGLNHGGGATFCCELEWIPGGELKSRVCIRFRSCISRSVQHPGVSHSVTCLPVAIAGTH